MSEDIVDLIRNRKPADSYLMLLDMAADEIERLRKELVRERTRVADMRLDTLR